MLRDPSARKLATKLKSALLAVFAVSGLSVVAPAEAARFCFVRLQPLGFGVYAPGTPSPVDSTGLLQIFCIGRPSRGQPSSYVMSISGGTSGDPSARYMSSSSSSLNYNLYQDAARTTIWGDGTFGTLPMTQGFSGRGFIFRRIHPIYGRSPAGQDPAPGSYVDTPLVTIEF